MTEAATLTLTDFLLAQIAKDEASARDALTSDSFEGSRTFYSGVGPHRDDWGLWTYNVLPAHILAECKAKRQIVEAHPYGESDGIVGHCCADPDTWLGERMYWDEPCPTLAILAAVYADRPGYREEWRPDDG